jgi:hypothetical protein
MGVWINKRKGEHTYMKDLNLNEVIYNQLRLINYDRSKSLLEQTKPINDSDIKRTVEFLKSLGHPSFEVGKSINETYANAMYSSTVELVRLFENNTKGLWNGGGCRTLTKWDSGGGILINAYDSEMYNKYEKLLPTHVANYEVTTSDVVDLSPVNHYTPSNTFFLRDFYFHKDKIKEDIKKTFRYDPNGINYKSDLFPDGYWNWFTTWFEGDNFNTIKNNLVSDIKKNQLVVCNKGRLVARTSISNEMSWSEVRTALHDQSLWVTLIAGALAILTAEVSLPAYFLFTGIGFAVDIADSIAYATEGDTFMAGLTFIFAVLPADVVFKYLGKGGKRVVQIFEPVLSKGRAMKEDIEYAIELARKEGLFPVLQTIAKGGKLAIKAAKTLVKKGFGFILQSIDLFAATRLIMWAIKKGYLLSSALFKMAIYMGGVGISWFAVAKILGIQTPLDAQEKSKTKALSVSDEMKLAFRGLKEFKVGISENENNDNAFTVFLQYFLMAYGWNKSVDVTQRLTPDKLNSLYNYNPNKKSKSESDLNKKGYVSYDELLSKKSNLDVKPLKLRYGVFDYATKKSVMTFQYAKGLKPDGIVGKNTLSYILDEMNTNKKNISNPYYGNNEKLTLEVEKAFNKYTKEAEEKFRWEQLKEVWENSEKQRQAAAKAQETEVEVDAVEDIKILMTILENMQKEADNLDSQPTPEGNTDKGFPIGRQFNPETGSSIPIYNK